MWQGAPAQLQEAIAKQKVDKARSVLDRYPTWINSPLSAGTAPLFRATQTGNAKMVALLLERKAAVNATNTTGFTALHCAVSNNDAAVGRLLIENLADPNQPDNRGVTPLQLSLDLRSDCVVQLLLDANPITREDTVLQSVESDPITREDTVLQSVDTDPTTREAHDPVAKANDRAVRSGSIIDCSASDTVQYIKEEVAQRLGVSPELVVLMFDLKEDSDQPLRLPATHVIHLEVEPPKLPPAPSTASPSSLSLSLSSTLTLSSSSPQSLDPKWLIPLEDLEIDEGASLGSGSFGEVKRATWLRSIKVAVKRMYFMSSDPAALQAMGGALDSSARETVLKEFIKEYSVNSSIRHPNIVMFLGVAVDRADEPRFLVLELMERGSLHDEIYPGRTTPRSEPPMTLERLASILLDITRALVYLHSRKAPVLHLDLKPKNVLVDRSGMAKLGDLGESHVIQSQGLATHRANNIGTPAYMAPEMAIEGAERGPPADMFMLGVTACEMSSGVPPNPGAGLRKVNRDLQSIPEQERRAGQLAAMQHTEIRELVNNLIVDEPDDRWTAPQVVSHLGSILQLQ